jgi:uncharacterized repeat protein (TIGR01451 family)
MTLSGWMRKVEWSRWYRRGTIALATLTLCSCRQMHPCPSQGFGPQPQSFGPQATGDTLPPQAFTGQPGDGYTRPYGAVPVAPTAPFGIPLPQTLVTPWAPPGIALPWPRDEYLHDGGDKIPDVRVQDDWRVSGLDSEDTVVHYDTIDGQTVVEPSNRVHIYSPRFAAVRQVSGAEFSIQNEALVGIDADLHLVQHDERRGAEAATQPLQPIGEIGTRQASIARLKQGEGRLANELPMRELKAGFLPYENYSAIRMGIIEQSEKARLMESIDAAITWTRDQAVQVVMDGVAASVETGDQRAQATFTIDVPNNPKLRVIKVASTNVALPGEIVDFTIRFDNIGDQKIGNVTLIDNLTTRLEYVEGTAQASRKAEFFTEVNEQDSLVLRWEFAEPLGPGEGGLVRFHCRVR